MSYMVGIHFRFPSMKSVSVPDDKPMIKDNSVSSLTEFLTQEPITAIEHVLSFRNDLEVERVDIVIHARRKE